MCFMRGHTVAVSYLAGQATALHQILLAWKQIQEWICVGVILEFRLLFGDVNTLTNTVLRSTNAWSEHRSPCANTPITVNHFA